MPTLPASEPPSSPRFGPHWYTYRLPYGLRATIVIYRARKYCIASLETSSVLWNACHSVSEVIQWSTGRPFRRNPFVSGVVNLRYWYTRVVEALRRKGRNHATREKKKFYAIQYQRVCSCGITHFAFRPSSCLYRASLPHCTSLTSYLRSH